MTSRAKCFIGNDMCLVLKYKVPTKTLRKEIDTTETSKVHCFRTLRKSINLKEYLLYKTFCIHYKNESAAKTRIQLTFFLQFRDIYLKLQFEKYILLMSTDCRDHKPKPNSIHN